MMDASTVQNMLDKTMQTIDDPLISADLSSEDIGSLEEEMPEDKLLSSTQTSLNLVPFSGQRFISQDAAYEFYCNFAKQCGFSIRRHRTRGKDGIGQGVTRRDFACHRSGYPQAKHSDDNRPQRNRKSSRCGCQAYMRIVKRSDYDVLEWRVTGFSNIHNHELMKPNEVHMIPAYCPISTDDKSRICLFAKAGMNVRQMLRLMELEKGVKLGCLPFMELDVRNLLQSFRNFDRDNDAIDLIAMCKRIKDEDPDFRYEFEIGAWNRLECISWSFASSIRLYKGFGDVVVLDTTHRIDAYDMVLGIWIGIDNHGMNCFFGCALLQDESLQSFSWALKTFLGFMNGKVPQSILTDQNICLKEAISIEMPNTKHAFCIWHIIARFSDWFSILLGARYDTFKAEFLRLYNLEMVEDFEEEWRKMVNTFALHTNNHVAHLYELRAFWALPYLRCSFFAGMNSTLYAESINAFIQRFLTAQLHLDNFVEQIAAVLESSDQLSSKHKRKVVEIQLKTGSPIESHSASVLTPYAFYKLQEEIVLAPQYATFPIDNNCFLVRHHTQMQGGCRVIWQPHEELVSCSCCQYEFSGILCKHALRVLSTNNCFQIPHKYIPSRWRSITNSNSANRDERVSELQSMVSSFISESVESEERLKVASELVAAALSQVREIGVEPLMLQEVEDNDGIFQNLAVGNGDESYDLRKLEERRSKEGNEVLRKKNSDGVPFCVQFRDEGDECSMMGSEGLNGVDLEFL